MSAGLIEAVYPSGAAPRFRVRASRSRPPRSRAAGARAAVAQLSSAPVVRHPGGWAIRSLADLRQQQPALRYGRLYFRPISGNGSDFGVSIFRNGVVAFSRLLNDQEVVVIANTSLDSGFAGEVIVDAFLNEDDTPCSLVFSNIPNPQQPGRVRTRGAGTVRIQEAEGGGATGPVRTVRVDLRPTELQVLRNA